MARFSSGAAALVGVVLFALLTTGCLFGRPAPRFEPPPEEPAPEVTPEPTREPSAETTLRKQNTKLELRLAEKQARIEQLDSQVVALQSRLDQAIQEVVRTTAKLGSLESRAEAASELAEAEIALKALRERAGTEGTPESLQAQRLLDMGTEEFRRRNYGGALFLIAQAKSQIRTAASRLGTQREVDPAEGETAFDLPLPLQLRTRSNVRSGPGLGFEIVATLDAGSSVTGYSYRGEWVRVESGDGTPGWIHQELVVGR